MSDMIVASLWTALPHPVPSTQQSRADLNCLFSGGQDSSTLAWLLYHAETVHPTLVHCNHLWQEDSFFMAQHALRVSFWLEWPVSVFLPTSRLTGEQQASTWRYTLAERSVCANTGSSIAVGHTASDKVESNFLHFLRTEGRTPTMGCRPTRNSRRGECSSGQQTGPYRDFVHMYSDRAAERATQVSRMIHTRLKPAKMPRPGTLTVHRPLNALTRTDTRLIAALTRFPVYPDRTNWESTNTRAQVRELVFPLLSELGLSLSD